jgi:hypothetical protein
MTANLLIIKERKRNNPIGFADPADFEFSDGSEIDPQLVVTNPLISLYCLDHANRRALFVETASGVDLSQAPFFYQAQYENTINLISVSYEMLHQLAKDISLDSHRLILVYSVGRAGSTLLGSVLNAVDGIVGISEPDVFTQLVALREWDGSNAAEISALVDTCLKLQCKPTKQIPQPSAWAIKFRSFSIELGDLLYAHYPHSKNIFLYRNAETWMVSSMRAFVDNESAPELRAWAQNWLKTVVPLIAEYVQTGGPLLTVSAMMSMMWLSVMAAYLKLNAKGMPGLPVRYEDLKASPRETVQKIFAYCGLPITQMDKVYEALAKDSQAGSALSHEKIGEKKFELRAEHKADLAKALQAHHTIHSPDFIIPVEKS